MAIFITLNKDNYSKYSSRGKLIAKTVKTAEIGIDDLAERIERNSTFKQGEVRGVIVEIISEMKRSLQAGEMVNIEGLGRFYLTVESVPAKTSKEFRTDRNIKSVKCKFLPSGRRDSNGKIVQLIADGVEVKRREE